MAQIILTAFLTIAILILAVLAANASAAVMEEFLLRWDRLRRVRRGKHEP